jgi:hypothetical protein
VGESPTKFQNLCEKNCEKLHPVGFEPTSTNTFELESNPLDRSGTDAMCKTLKN